jgi:hypothetical protein
MQIRKRIPPGLVRCKTCGEFGGTTFEKYLSRNPHVFDDPHYDPDRPVTALCRCHGPLCGRCAVNRVHRPMSGHYYEDINMVLHVPHFAYAKPCDSCASRWRLEALRTTQASLGPRDKAVHIPCELRPGESSRHGIFHMLTLSSNRIVWMSAMVVMPTYVSLVSGLPDPDSDAELILQARKRARVLWGDRPTHVIMPDYEYANDAGRTHLRMPPLQYYAWLESGPIKGSEKTCSQLVVIWFQRNGYVGLLESAERSLRALPWEKLAGGCDP